MTYVPGSRTLIDINDVKYKASVSEATLYKVGSVSNFISLYQVNMREFMINGPYGSIATPNYGVDGIVRFPYNWELVDLFIYSGESTSGTGTTSLDIKYKPFSSGSYTSIFSTIPSFNNTAPIFETCGIGQSKTGFVAPVLNKTLFDANDQLRIDLLGAIDTGVGCGIGLSFRPR